MDKAPKPNETPQIIAYVKANFDCEALIENNEMKVTGFKMLEVDMWIKYNLNNYLREDYPANWEDSLQQCMDKVNLKMSPVKQNS